MGSINGITIERYAELCAKMNDVIKDKDACLKIAEKEGIKKEDWEAAHKGWQAKITDPSDMGQTASKFVSLWQAALDKAKGGSSSGEPCLFDTFASIHVALSKNPGQKEQTLSQFGINMPKWQEYGAFWYPKMSSDMNLQSKIQSLMMQ